MEVLGIKKARDFDFVVSSTLHPDIFPELQKEYSTSAEKNDVIILEENVKTGEAIISISAATEAYMPQGKALIDYDLAINNDSYHIWFYGCKFLNLEFQIAKKKYRDYEKDRVDLRTIELYYDFIRNFDNKKILKEQIEAQLKRREEIERKRKEVMEDLENQC